MVDIRDVKVGDMLMVDEDLVQTPENYVISSMLNYAGGIYEVKYVNARSIHLDTNGFEFHWHPSVLSYPGKVKEIELDSINIDSLFT